MIEPGISMPIIQNCFPSLADTFEMGVFSGTFTAYGESILTFLQTELDENTM